MAHWLRIERLVSLEVKMKLPWQISNLLTLQCPMVRYAHGTGREQEEDFSPAPLPYCQVPYLFPARNSHPVSMRNCVRWDCRSDKLAG